MPIGVDESTLDGLNAALAATPDNAELRCLVIKAYLDLGRPKDAATAIDGRAPESFDTVADPTIPARALWAAEQGEKALDYVPPSGAGKLLEARIRLELDDRPGAQAAYRAAIEANPTLEDMDLARQLEASVVKLGQEGRRLTVISNDDTTEQVLDRVLIPEPEEVTFADVGGLADVKKQIHKRIILPFQKPNLFQRFKKRAGGGILMYGPPGCGKTLLARATAGECKASFFNVQISDVLDLYIGESERKLNALFEKARQGAPSVLFFDEIEALGGKRQYNRESGSAKLVSQFLSEMDGFARNNQGVLILAATNVPWSVDPAFRRPGRFDRVLFVPPPDRPARSRILDILLSSRPTAGDVQADAVAAKTGGFSGADLSNVVETAVDLAIEASIEAETETPVSQALLMAALKDVRPTTLEWLSTARNHARYANEGGQYDEVLEFLRKHGKE